MKSHRVNPAVGLVACLLASAPAAAADPPPDADDIDTYPVAQGRFTTPTYFYSGRVPRFEHHDVHS
jgi:hypothetical protein